MRWGNFYQILGKKVYDLAWGMGPNIGPKNGIKKGLNYYYTTTIMNVQTMPIQEILEKKRDGKILTEEEIKFFVRVTTNRKIQEAQLGAMLMAIFIKGLNDDETMHLTRAMKVSGTVLEWPTEWKDLLVDKHSTGGVGDKVSLVLAPVLAACGFKVPMISGRGLEHTGGTLDKLESIPGFRATLTKEEMRNSLDKVGCFIVGQSHDLVPADKIMYRTRDITSTVANRGLITGSIISKKAAESLNALVLDVKVGNGAFMKTQDEAKKLAKQMVDVGNKLGVKTSAVLTDMDTPLGKMAGNALEVKESIGCLQGKGPADLEELVIVLGVQLLTMCGQDKQVCEKRLRKAIHDKHALRKFKEMIQAQGVEEKTAENLCDPENAEFFKILPQASRKDIIPAKISGYIHKIHAKKCGDVVFKLGSGRTTSEANINHAVGLELHAQVGDEITEGDPWVTVHHDSNFTDELRTILEGAIEIQRRPRTLVLEVINYDDL